MIVYICVVWIAGSRHDGGITKCMWHESQVKYQTVAECEDDIKHSKKLLRLRIRQEFGDRPESISIQPSCVMESQMKHKDTLSKTHSTSRKWEKSMKKRTKKSQRQLDKKVAKYDRY